jgi:hypothetical protein
MGVTWSSSSLRPSPRAARMIGRFRQRLILGRAPVLLKGRCPSGFSPLAEALERFGELHSVAVADASPPKDPSATALIAAGDSSSSVGGASCSPAALSFGASSSLTRSSFAAVPRRRTDALNGRRWL